MINYVQNIKLDSLYSVDIGYVDMDEDISDQVAYHRMMNKLKKSNKSLAFKIAENFKFYFIPIQLLGKLDLMISFRYINM